MYFYTSAQYILQKLNLYYCSGCQLLTQCIGFKWVKAQIEFIYCYMLPWHIYTVYLSHTRQTSFMLYNTLFFINGSILRSISYVIIKSSWTRSYYNIVYFPVGTETIKEPTNSLHVRLSLTWDISALTLCVMVFFLKLIKFIFSKNYT